MPTGFAFSYRERQTKRKGVVYDVVFRIVDENGREVQKSLCGYASKKLAKAAYLEFMSTYVAPPKKYDGKSKIIYDDAVKQYLATIQSQIKESSMYDALHTFKMHIDPFFTKRDIASITKQDVYAWQDRLVAMKKPNGELYSLSRISHIRMYFRSFAKWCANRYEIKDFFEGVEMPIKRSQKREYVIWTKDDFVKFYAAVDDPRYKAVFYTMFFSGVRIGELQALMPSDFDGSQLTIRHTFTRKTLDDSTYKITEVKNYKLHKVPLPDHAATVLKEWLKYKAEHGLDNVFIFGGKGPLSQHAIQYALNKGIAAAGVPKIRLHDFRHSYVSMLLSNGVNFAVIATLIGDTLEQVVKTYAHLTPADLVKAVETL